MEIDEVTASSFVFKLVAFFESMRNYREGIDFINRLLQSYIDSQQYEKAYIAIEFVFYYSSRTDLNEINESYYREIQSQVSQMMTERENTIKNLSLITHQKYDCLFSVIHFFDQKLLYSEYHMRLLKSIFVTTYSSAHNRQQLNSMNNMTFLCLAFNNPMIFNKLWQFEERVHSIRFKGVLPIAFTSIKRAAADRQPHTVKEVALYVMKFDYKSKSKRRFRYLCVRNSVLAVISKPKMESLVKAKSGQKGICKLTRLSRMDQKGPIRPSQSQNARTQIQKNEDDQCLRHSNDPGCQKATRVQCDDPHLLPANRPSESDPRLGFHELLGHQKAFH